MEIAFRRQSLLLKNLSTKTTRRSFASLPTSTQVISYTQTGNPQSVLKLETQPLPTLGNGQILVKFLASPINPADLNQIEGVYGVKAKLPAVGGNEGVAVVVASGSGVSKVQVNDHVIPSRPGLGTWRTYGVFNESDFQTVPKDVKPEYAATVSVNPSTALRLLDDFVNLKEGDVIIQNGANSMVGYSVLQIANARKIKTINVVRSRPDQTDVVERLKTLGGYVVVTDDYLTTPEFKKLVSDLPAPKLALNCIGGTTSTEFTRLLAPGGTMVTYGGMSRKPVTVPTSALIFKDIQLRGFWLTKWLEQHPQEDRTKMLNSLFEMIKKDQLKLWIEDWKFSKFQQALQRVNEPYRDRKVVLTMNE